MENLFENSSNGHLKLGNTLIQWGNINHLGNQYTLVFPIAFKEGTTPAISISTWQYSEMPVHNSRNNKQCPFFSDNRISIDWIAVGMI